MKKVEKVLKLVKTNFIADGTIIRELGNANTFQPFNGMTILIEGDYIVFTSLGQKVLLAEEMIESIDEDNAITFRLKDDDGFFKIEMLLRAP